MPELPEVETIVRDLRPQLVGRRIESMQIKGDPGIRGRLVGDPSPAQFLRRLRGRTIKSVERRGKYIVMPLEAAPDETIRANGALEASGERVIVHLGMTGHLRVWEPEETPVKHTHFSALLDSGLELRYDDPRQFARLLVATLDELSASRRVPNPLG